MITGTNYQLNFMEWRDTKHSFKENNNTTSSQ